jgi:hypothetical protein
MTLGFSRPWGCAPEALAVVLFNYSWRLQVLVGDKVILSRNGVEIEPFSLLNMLSQCQMDMKEWARICDDAGITGKSLDDPRVLQFDDEIRRVTR